MSTATATHATLTAADVLRAQAQVTHHILRQNTEGITHEESLTQPGCGGNCLNWVAGHLLWVNEMALSALGQQPVLGVDALTRYQRGSAELHDPSEALPLDQLLSAWDESWSRIDAALAAISP